MATKSSAPPVEPVGVPGVKPCGDLPRLRGAGQVGSGRLPDVALPCLTGGPPVMLSKLGGRPAILNLWATWCGPCREEMPVLQDGHERYGERIAFVGVNTKDNLSAAAHFLADVDVTYPQLADVDGRLLSHTRIPGLPVTVVLDARGQITKQHVGPLTDEGLTDLVEGVLDLPH